MAAFIGKWGVIAFADVQDPPMGLDYWKRERERKGRDERKGRAREGKGKGKEKKARKRGGDRKK